VFATSPVSKQSDAGRFAAFDLSDEAVSFVRGTAGLDVAERDDRELHDASQAGISLPRTISVLGARRMPSGLQVIPSSR
jgi:hypothetical protein